MAGGGFDDYEGGAPGPDRPEPPADDFAAHEQEDPRYLQYLQQRGDTLAERPRLEALPNNVEAEAALLGALMIDNRLVEDVGYLGRDDFFDEMHRVIYDRIRELVLRDKIATPVTLRPFFEHDELMKAYGGPAYLAMLTGSGAAIIGARDFAEQIRDLSELRQIVKAAQGTIDRCMDTSDSLEPTAIVSELDAELALIGAQSDRVPTASLADAWDDLVDEFKEIEEGKPPAGFVIDLFRDWNAVVGRMEEGDCTYLAARPSMGKSGVALAVATGAAAAGIATEVILLEGDRRKGTRRILANLIYQPGVTSGYQDLSVGKLTMHDLRAMADARKKLADWPLHISDPAVMYVEDVVPHIRRRQRVLTRKGLTLKLVILDYLDRLETRKKFNSQAERVSYISRSLKAAAKTCGVHLIVLCQLSRALESRDNKRPMLSDLRDSGSLEQDADNVVFLYRDEYYQERMEPPKDKAEKWNKWADEMTAVRDVLEIYSSKRREGPLLKKLAKFFTTHQAVRDHDFFEWRGNASPIGPQDDGPSFDLPERRGV